MTKTGANPGAHLVFGRRMDDGSCAESVYERNTSWSD